MVRSVVRSLALALAAALAPVMLVVNASKAKPESVSIGSIGNGTLGHLVLALT